jgi:pyrimidine deaminase RibD-like protein
LVETCYKGEVNQLLKSGRDITWDKHCEYSLFTEKIGEENLDSIKGGTLFVTLEPCNKRKSYLDENGVRKPKIPCAVRCVEAGLRRIYIGSYDYNPKVKHKGEEILKSGTYTFPLKNKKLDFEDKKEKRDAELLQNYFDENKYERTITDDEIIYKIGEPVKEVIPFDSDLREEVLELNAWFLSHHEEEIYRKYE